MTTDTRILRVLPSVAANTGDRTEGRPITIFAALTNAEFEACEHGGAVLDNARIVHIVIGREPNDADREKAAERFRSMGNG